MSEYPDPRSKDDTDAVQDIARDLAEVAGEIATFKGEANAYLGDPNYNALRLRLENAHTAVEAAAVEAAVLKEPIEISRKLVWSRLHRFAGCLYTPWRPIATLNL